MRLHSASLIVSSWYNGGEYHVSGIYTDGFYLSDFGSGGGGVESLVNAMAAYDVPVGAGSIVPQSVRDALEPVIASTWQESDRALVMYS